MIYFFFDYIGARESVHWFPVGSCSAARRRPAACVLVLRLRCEARYFKNHRKFNRQTRL